MAHIQYSEKYFDDTFDYRHVVLPSEVSKLLPKISFFHWHVVLPSEVSKLLPKISFFHWKLSDVLWEAVSTGRIVSLYQGLGTKNLQSLIAQFVYFYGYSYFKRLYQVKYGTKSIRTKANLILASSAGACTAIITQPLDTASSKMQTSAFGNREIKRSLGDA